MSHESPIAARIRKLQHLQQGATLPVLVVGGGINGAGTFRDLAYQGVDCLIVDKADWCSGTSAAPSRLIHGGLKYLETGEFRLVAESTHERNRLLRNAPHLVKPLATTVPIRSYLGGIWPGLLRFLGRPAKLRDRGLLLVEVGLTLYDWLGRKERVMPRHRVALRRKSHRDVPGLDPDVIATSTYYDARVTLAERLCYEVVADGERAHAGAIALNYVSLVGSVNGRVRLRDETTGEAFELAPQVVVNAAGPWIDRVNHAVGLNRDYIGGTKGSHVLVDAPGLLESLGGRMIYYGLGDGRICLVYPFFGTALLGTTDLKADDPDRIRCDDDEVSYILASINTLFPKLNLTADKIRFRYAGLRPLPATAAADPGEISRDHVMRSDALPGSDVPLLSLIGGKWTTFRAFAEQATDAVLQRLGRTRTRSTAAEPIGGGRHYPGTAVARQGWIDGLIDRFGVTTAHAALLLDRYGTAAPDILSAGGTGSDVPLRSLPSYGAAELRGMAQREQIVHLIDLVFRRTAIAVSEPLTLGALEELAATIAPVLGWSAEHCAAEVTATIATAREKHGMRI